jgi:two-component system sensor histidine kinase RegB
MSASLPNTTLHPASVLGRLVGLRWVAVAAQAATLLLAIGWLDIALPWWPMVVAVLSLFVVNALTWGRLGMAWPVSDGELFSQLCVDVLVLGWLLYYAGGSSNPFVSLFVLPLTIAAITLPTRYVWAMAGLALAAYTLLVFVNVPLPEVQGRLKEFDEVLTDICGVGQNPNGHAGHSAGFALHIAGMWLNFVISALIVAVFLARQAHALRQREQQLHSVRERALRNERVLALGLLAAGAAHKLGTPLATMAVLLGELEHEYAEQAAIGADLRLLRGQVERCKAIIGEIVAAASDAAPPARSAEVWLAGLIDEWQLLRPQVSVSQQLVGSGQPPLLRPERTVDQALQSLLDNAADACPQGIEVRLGWSDSELRVDILDRGPGVDAAVIAALGKTFVTTKQAGDGGGAAAGGLGIGFFLTNATIEGYGGEVEVFPREQGGTRTVVVLPLARLQGEDKA